MSKLLSLLVFLSFSLVSANQYLNVVAKSDSQDQQAKMAPTTLESKSWLFTQKASARNAHSPHNGLMTVKEGYVPYTRHCFKHFTLISSLSPYNNATS